MLILLVMPTVGVEAGTGAGTPPLHAPSWQNSPLVQELPSSQGARLFAYTQPVAALQESSVQMLPSLQVIGVMPVQAVPLQVPKLHWLPPIEHVEPAVASAHVELQQSPSVELPSSQASPASLTPLPHTIK